MSEQEATLALTPTMLKELVASAVTAAIAEVRKPAPPSTEQQAITDQKQKMRQQTAEQIVEIIHNRRQAQLTCTHEHSKRSGGGTHCVYVKEENPASPGYIFCQLCQGRFRPGTFAGDDRTQPAFYRDRGAIYDTDKFNRLFQECAANGIMGG
jgi:hypothetical protein